MTTPTLESERIIIRPLKISDAEAIYKNWATDPDVVKYLRWNVHQSINVTIEWLTFEEKNIGNENILNTEKIYQRNYAAKLE